MPNRILAVLLLAAAVAPVPRAAADAPSVSSFFPAGAPRGETVTVKAQGSFKPWPVEARVDRPGVTFRPGEEAGTFEVAIAPDASPGLCWVRLYNEEGAAPLRPFEIGTLPEVVEEEPNDANDQARQLDPSGVVTNGRLERSNDVDAYGVALESGQTIVASVESHRRLGSPMDGVLQVVSPEGFVLDHADDSPGLDPSLAFTAPSSGTYIIRVFAFPAEPNSSIRFAGGNDYVYRLTLTTGGLVEFAHPSAITREGDRPPVSPVGWNISDGADPLEITPVDERLAFAWQGDRPGTAEVTLVDLPVMIEPAVAADADADADPIPMPALICGRISSPGELDTIPVLAPAGRSIRVRVSARSLGSPLDPVLRVVAPSGDQLAESDDAGRNERDPEVTVKVPDQGALHLQVRDLHGRGGHRFLYRIEATEVTPDFVLSVGSDHIELQPGTPEEIPVTIDRRDGFDQPITFEAEGLPEGVNLEPVVSEPKGDSSKKVTLRLSGVDAPTSSGPIRLLGRPEGAGPARPVRSDRVGGPPTPELWLTVTPSG